MSAAQAMWLSVNRKLHLQHGPIDLVVEIDASESVRSLAFSVAVDAFELVLERLVDELPLLRTELRMKSSAGLSSEHAAIKTGVSCKPPVFSGNVANRMLAAVLPYRQHRITPMAAVAGSVADHVLQAIVAAAPIRRGWVNNGGDIAIHLQPGESFDCAIVDNPLHFNEDGLSPLRCGIIESDGIGGIATSGRHGRSLSLGIADSVTVLAHSAAAADAAATMIANQVDLPGSESIKRSPADSLDDDSDLGGRMVVTEVEPLTSVETTTALSKGHAFALQLQARNLLRGALLTLQGQTMQIPINQSSCLPARSLFTSARSVGNDTRRISSPMPASLFPAREPMKTIGPTNNNELGETRL